METYEWIEKGTRFNNKDYHFSMRQHEYYDAVEVECKYGQYSTVVIVSPDEEKYLPETLDEMKELLYNWSYK